MFSMWQMARCRTARSRGIRRKSVDALGRQEPFMNQTLATSALPCWRDFSAMAGSSIIADPSTPEPAK